MEAGLECGQPSASKPLRASPLRFDLAPLFAEASTGRSVPASGDRRVQGLSLATGAQIHALRTKTVQVSGVASQQCIKDDGGPPGCTDLPTRGLFLRLVPPFLCRSD